MDLPLAFTQQLTALLGPDEASQLFNSLSLPVPVGIRLNAGKIHKYTTIPHNLKQERIPWCENGYYLKQRIPFTFDPLFQAGIYYVQEASSMFLEQVLKKYITSPACVLDLCAAPGGKSTHIRDILPENSLLVSNEVIRSRSNILAENMIKWGNPDVVVTNNDPKEFSRIDSFFDVIVADVPCSGEGMFRKDPEAIREWSPENVTICYQRQRRIIADCWKALREDGLLIYSTCTYNIQENEENIEWICNELGAEVLPVEIPQGCPITGNLMGNHFPVYRFLPHKTTGEGFFIAVLRKTDSDTTTARDHKKKKEKKREAKSKIPTEVRTWITDPDHYTFLAEENTIRAISTIHHNAIQELGNKLHILHSGITLGEVKGKNIIPHHSLAMSNQLNREAFPIHEIDYDLAIRYLRSEAIALDNNVPTGFVLLTHQSVPLGFVKNIGNRANNLYPQEWRIRSGYLPEGQTTLF